MPQKSPFQIDIPQVDILSWLFPPGTKPSEKPIWIDAEQPDRKHLSPRELLQWVKRLGMGLQRLGLRKGDVVMVLSTNHIFMPVAYLGIAGSGLIFSGANPVYGVDEVAFQIRNTEAKAILVEPPLLDVLTKAAQKTSFPTPRIYLFSDDDCQTINGMKDWKTIIAPLSESFAWRWPTLSGTQSATTTAVLNYSSGTTGLPKGVMISHQNVIANVEQSIFMRDLEQPYTLNNTPRPEERWLGFLPLYHAYGQLWSISAAAKTLSPCYFMRTFNYPSFLSHLQNHKITHIQTAPPILVMLAKRPETSNYDLSSLVNILCGAAPLSKELQNEVSQKLNLKVVQTWGMTEVTCSSLHVPGGLDDRSGSVGYPDPNCTMKLIDDAGNEVPLDSDERGEIHVKGPNVCQGYWRNEEATRATFDSDGFLRTGDVAVRGKEGWYWIVDRKKELIKVQGFQVPPAELEAKLLENDDVADAAVVGVQLEHEEVPRAYVVLKENSRGKVSEESIVKWMAANVAKHKQLTGGVAFIDEVPKSPSGKIQRKIMKDWARRDAGKVKNPRAKL